MHYNSKILPSNNAYIKSYWHLNFQVLSHPIRNIHRNLYSALPYMGMLYIVASICILPRLFFSGSSSSSIQIKPLPFKKVSFSLV